MMNGRFFRVLQFSGFLSIVLLLTGCSGNFVREENSELLRESLATDTPAPTATPSPTATAVAGIGRHEPQSVELMVDGETAVYEYYLYLPEDYPAQESWPLIVFLHGANSRGDNIIRVRNQSFTMSLGNSLQLPAIVISPQAPNGTFWDERIPILEALVTAVSAQYAVDPSRIYLTGFSMGGFGSWAWAIENPDLFAAVVPVAGGYLGLAEDACVLKDTPVWAFASTADEMVAGSRTEVLVDALKECGAENVKLTLYDDANHGETGTRPYLPDSELYPWLWEQSLPAE